MLTLSLLLLVFALLLGVLLLRGLGLGLALLGLVLGAGFVVVVAALLLVLLGDFGGCELLEFVVDTTRQSKSEWHDNEERHTIVILAVCIQKRVWCPHMRHIHHQLPRPAAAGFNSTTTTPKQARNT